METEVTPMKKYRDKVLISAVVIGCFALIFFLLKDLLPLLRQVMSDAENETEMIQYIKAYGAKGVPILMGLQFLQVMIPFFPASPIQVLGGLCYGVFLGSLLCLIGFIAGHSFLFLAVRKVGDAFLPQKTRWGAKMENNKMLGRILSKNTLRPEIMVFLLYLIPMFPNGMLPFVFSRTRVKYKNYLLYMVAAMVPSTVVCTMVGDRLAAGELMAAVIIGGIFFLFMGLVFIFKNKILALFDRNKTQEED